VVDWEDRSDSSPLAWRIWFADDPCGVGRRIWHPCWPQAGCPTHACSGIARGKPEEVRGQTTADPKASRPIDLVERRFYADGPNRLWVADITFIPTWSGFLYLAIVLDVYSRRIVGWAMETHLRTELILSAFEMALAQRRPNSVIHHSDRGCQYTSYAFGKRCREAGVMPSMGSVGDAYDNAMAESFFATLERELLSRRRFRSQAEARMAVFEWLEGWYNPHRRHSSLGYRSPINYERAHQHWPGRIKKPALLPPAASDSPAV